MRKWRPTTKCLYVIPDVSGCIESLGIIFSRILPLRFSIGQQDKMVMMGNYIDIGSDSADIIDLLIDAQREHQDSFICLKGKSEQLLLDSLVSLQAYNEWMIGGGISTIQSYLSRSNLSSSPTTFPHARLIDIIPKSHIDFLQSLPSSIELDGHLFFDQDINRHILANDPNLIYVRSISGSDKFTNIRGNNLVMGRNAPKRLYVVDMLSMTCAMIKQGKSRIYKRPLKVRT